MRKLLAALAAGGAVGAAVAALVAGRGAGPGRAASEPAAPVTATVARRDLVDRQSVDGTLGYDDAHALAGRIPGTITWLPAEGSIVRRGGVLYRVDGEPVTLMDGAVPAWRTLSEGVEDGSDVLELERNLRALGYDPDGELTVDEHFSSATRAAVERWQDAQGVEQTGRVDLGRVVFAATPRRVGRVTAAVGAQALGSPFVLSSARRVVSANVDAAELTLVHVGDTVLVDLPTGDEVRGTISDVSRVAQGGGDSGTGAVVPIEVRFARRTRLPALDQAPVTVQIASERLRDALSVPVTALVAQPGGAYAVEVVDGAARRFVPVSLGAFAGGYVQVAGRGVKPGLRVVVPS